MNSERFSVSTPEEMDENLSVWDTILLRKIDPVISEQRKHQATLESELQEFAAFLEASDLVYGTRRFDHPFDTVNAILEAHRKVGREIEKLKDRITG